MGFVAAMASGGSSGGECLVLLAHGLPSRSAFVQQPVCVRDLESALNSRVGRPRFLAARSQASPLNPARHCPPKKAVLAANQEAQQTSLARTGDLLRAHARAALGIALGQMLELIELM